MPVYKATWEWSGREGISHRHTVANSDDQGIEWFDSLVGTDSFHDPDSRPLNRHSIRPLKWAELRCADIHGGEGRLVLRRRRHEIT